MLARLEQFQLLQFGQRHVAHAALIPAGALQRFIMMHNQHMIARFAHVQLDAVTCAHSALKGGQAVFRHAAGIVIQSAMGIGMAC